MKLCMTMAAAPAPDVTRATIEFLALTTSQLAEVRDIETLATTLQEIICRLVTVEYMATYFVHPDTGALRMYAALGFDEEDRREAERTAADRHPGRVVRSGETIHIPDVTLDTQQRTQDSARKFVVRSRLFMPVRSAGVCCGTIGLSSTRVNYFSELHIAALDFICRLAGGLYKNVTDNQELVRQLGRVSRQEHELRRLSSPIIEVWERIFAVPLIGAFDAPRFALLAETLLTATVSRRAQTVILDLTGVELLDTAGAQYIGRLGQAIRLLGGQCILSGISPILAKKLVLAGSELGHLPTFSTLRQALASTIRGAG